VGGGGEGKGGRPVPKGLLNLKKGHSLDQALFGEEEKPQN